MTKVIGIAGGTASGKTSIIHQLEQDLGGRGMVITMDAYYKPYQEYSFEERVRFNYDHPDAFDIDRLIADLNMLLSGQTVEIPVYDYVNYTRSEETIAAEPKPVILLEGLFVLYFPALQPLLDLKVFIDADADTRLIRRIRRDQLERGRSLASILDQYEETIKPMHEAFVLPTKSHADLIIPRGAENIQGVTILRNHVKRLAEAEEER
ncbi:MAG: uridine kinase [Peptoniphilaceae bacterium]|nr:uridine kinase [Peptoniphilaceae bacterium]MDY6085396.1 uridine kinase [Peptoniphilaceae bacterium]